MNQDIIETVARAICQAQGQNPDFCPPSTRVGDSDRRPAWMEYRKAAKAAIGAVESQ